jgi:hypothetical protein
MAKARTGLICSMEAANPEATATEKEEAISTSFSKV